MTQLTHDRAAALLGVGGRSVPRLSLADALALCKPRITGLVVLTAWLGYAAAGVAATAWQLAAALAGTGLACMGAAALNQVLERDTDGLMRRTAQRPLPAGRATVTQAAALGLLASALGVGLLAAGANLLAAGVAAFTIGSYVLLYTPLKRVTPLSTFVGAVPGALPPVIGYAAAAGELALPAAAMFALMFLWQIPHFLAIAWLYREDYARAGLPVLGVVDPTGRSTFRQMLIGCAALLPVSLLPTAIGMTGTLYLLAALAAGTVFLAFGVAVVARQSAPAARAMFFASLFYLPLVLAMMLVDRA